MVIGGLQKFSLADFPGKISAIVFTQGCNFRCPYCHNPELVDPAQYSTALSKEEVLRFLGSRTHQLQGVVVTGGEPTLHEDLPSFLAEIRELGFAVKVDTNGSNPELLKEIIHDALVDYIAMDIKAPLRSYPRVTGVPVRVEDIARSVRLVIESGLPHEMRTTYSGLLLSTEEMADIAGIIRGCALYVVQGFRASHALDPGLRAHSGPDNGSLLLIRSLMEKAGHPVLVR